MRRLFSLIVCALALLAPLSAENAPVHMLWDVDFLFHFDNREYNHPYEETGTITGIRLTPTIGVEYADSLHGTHRLVGGVTYLQPFGAGWRYAKVLPTLYYAYSFRGWDLHFGFVPYRCLYRPLPDYLLSDSLSFTDPNIRGTLVQYHSSKGEFSLLADWRGMMTDTAREAFRIVAGGRYVRRWFYVGGYAQYNHLSHSLSVKGVLDDWIAQPFVGLDFTRQTPLDTLAIQAGYMVSFERNRRAKEQYIGHGLYVDAALRWKWIGVRNALYVGDDLMPFHEQYGSLLYQGTPMFRSSLYNRTDFRLYFLRLPFVEGAVEWDLIYTKNFHLSHQQKIVCRFSVEDCLRYAKRR